MPHDRPERFPKHQAMLNSPITGLDEGIRTKMAALFLARTGDPRRVEPKEEHQRASPML